MTRPLSVVSGGTMAGIARAAGATPRQLEARGRRRPACALAARACAAGRVAAAWRRCWRRWSTRRSTFPAGSTRRSTTGSGSSRYKEGKRVTLLTRNMKDRTARFPRDRRRARGAARRRRSCSTARSSSSTPTGVSRFQLLQRRGDGRIAAALRGLRLPLRAGPRSRTGSRSPAPRRALEARGRGGARAGASPAAGRRRPRGVRRGAPGARPRGRDRQGPALTVRGRRALAAWRKVKVRAEEEFVIGGYTAPRGGRQPSRRAAGRRVGRRPRSATRARSAPGSTRARSRTSIAASRPLARAHVALRRRPARARRHLARAAAGRADRLHRAHRRRQASPPHVPGAARRQAANIAGHPPRVK